jgi:hypothetical protein
MGCMLMTMGLEESISGLLFKNISSKLDEMDQHRLTFSKCYLLWFKYHSRAFHIIYRARGLPTWRKLYHFDKIMDVSYTDATKLKDLVKVSMI